MNYHFGHPTVLEGRLQLKVGYCFYVIARIRLMGEMVQLDVLRDEWEI